MEIEEMDEGLDAAGVDSEMSNDEEPLFLLLPEEMFLHICSYLDVQEILTLSKVCRKFNLMLQSNDTWRTWIATRWGRHAPIIQVDEDTNWKRKCFFLEKDWKIFRGPFHHHKIYSNSIDFDSILLINGGDLCVAGSRDRKISVYGSLRSNPQLLSQQAAAHQGWVWRLKYLNNRLYSASWDHTIKLWDFDSSLSLTQVSLLRCESAALSMDVQDNGVVYGGSFNYVYAFDPRVASEPIFTVSAVQSPVITLNILENDLVSGCENKTLTVWDMRSRETRQVFKLKNGCYPFSAQVTEQVLYVGDNKGNLRVYQNKDGQLSETAVIDLNRKKPVPYTKMSTGSLIINCDHRVTAYLPFTPLKTIAEFQVDGGTITSMDYCDGLLAYGTPTTLEFQESLI